MSFTWWIPSLRVAPTSIHFKKFTLKAVGLRQLRGGIFFLQQILVFPHPFCPDSLYFFSPHGGRYYFLHMIG